MCIAAYSLEFSQCDQRSPGLTEICSSKNIGSHVAERVAIESDIGAAGIEIASLDPTNPRILRQAGHIADKVVPTLAAITRELKIAVVRSYPDDRLIFRRFANRINRRVHLRRGVVYRHATRLFLLLLFRVVCRQIGRNPFPGLTVIAGSKEELRANVNGFL